MDTKICSFCNIEYPATTEYFNRDGRYEHALRTKCKACEKSYREANKKHKQEIDRAYREANRDRLLKQKSEYYYDHKEHSIAKWREWVESNRERYKAYQRDYTKKRKEKKSDYDKQYREKNRQAIMDRQKRWEKENLSHARMLGRAAAARRNAKKRSALGSHTGEDIKRIYKSQKGRCYYCGKKVGKTYHVDHVVPISRGGSNSPDNLVISCEHCNVTKSARLPHEWPQGGRLL